MTDTLLTTATVGDYLRGRGLIAGEPDFVQTLAGGVSNIVLAVRDGDRSYAVKQSLEQLAVADDWHAPVDRVLTEAAALTVCREITPDAVPRVLDEDAAHHTIVLELAPDGWRDWKADLLAGSVDRRVAGELGAILAAWHSATAHRSLGPRFETEENFRVLRVDPYYRTVARRAPEQAERITELIADLHVNRRCLVHGDFSPKNVLVGPGADPTAGTGVWVIDFEVAHRGNPAFDVAFLLCHLTLKAIHVPTAAADLDAATDGFLAAYHAGIDPSVEADPRDVLGHVGALLMARVIGTSPVEYLTEPEKLVVRSLGASLTADPPTDYADLRVRRERTAS